MQKKNTHVRKSNYRPPKSQTEKHVRETIAQDRSEKINVRSASRKSSRNASVKKQASPHKGTALRSIPARHPSPLRLILWTKSKKKILSLKSAVLFLTVCLLGGTGIHFAYKLGSGLLTREKKAAEAISREAESKEEKLLEMEKTDEISFSPHSVASTKPENFIDYTEVQVNGALLENISEYVPENPISFDSGKKYSDVNGIITFRGNNFRDTAAYGSAGLKEKTLTEKWTKDTGSLSSEGTVWTGSGWTGQPLIQKWPKEIRAHMNMYDWAKDQDKLTEVIYACMDGYVYFLDLATGKETRDALYLGYTFKGSGALDPRGYPIL